MNKVFLFIIVLITVLAAILLLVGETKETTINLNKMSQEERIEWYTSTSNEEKEYILTRQQYFIIVERQMEASYLGDLTYNTEEGNYHSAVCNYHLFSSKDKFPGKSGWLDFENINMSNAQFKENYRTEVIEVFSICGEYLGYVVENEALESKQHFIINSESLIFQSN